MSTSAGGLVTVAQGAPAGGVLFGVAHIAAASLWGPLPAKADWGLLINVVALLVGMLLADARHG